MGSARLVVTLETRGTTTPDRTKMGKSALHVLAKRSTADFGSRDREREKRKKILKMCVQKLRDIDDPETVLCRAVLINNTFKTLKYAYRRVLKADPEPPQIKDPEAEESDNEEEDDEEEQGSEEEDISTDESSNEEENQDVAMPVMHSNTSDSLDCLDSTSCDIQTFNAESIVHSLMMPPLLSPQIEDMTNCSFYDSFSLPSDHNANSSDTTSKTNDAFCLDNSHDTNTSPSTNNTNTTTTTLKLTMMTESNPSPDTFTSSSSSQLDYCHSSDFSSCAKTDIGNSLLIDNLLTEIVQG